MNARGDTSGDPGADPAFPPFRVEAADYLRALPTFRDALYFSTISYSTIGYNDASIADEWRMIAALEGMLGVILLGWSTAFLVRVIGNLEGDDAANRPPLRDPPREGD